MKKFKPIAMRCNQQQYAEIKQILIDNGFKTSLYDTFDRCPYLINNYDGNKNNICNCFSENKTNFNRTVFETWNKNTFLEYCGIENKNNWVPKVGDWAIRITNGNYVNKVTKNKAYKVTNFNGTNALYVKDDTDIEDMFDLCCFRKAEPHEIPNIQNNKTEFIVGKWYKLNDWIAKLKKLEKTYFWCDETIRDKKYNNSPGYLDLINYNNPILLTDLTEIQQYLPDNHPDKIISKPNLNDLLIEAKRRYPIGTKFKAIRSNGEISDTVTTQIQECYLYKTNDDTQWIIGSANIYNPIVNKWAEIIEPAKPVETKSIYQIAAEKAMERFKDIQIGDEYMTMFESKEIATKLPEIIGDCEDCFIDCGIGYLWQYNKPDKFGYKVNKQNNIKTDAYPLPPNPLQNGISFYSNPLLGLQGIGYESSSLFDTFDYKSSLKQIQPNQLIKKKKIVMDTKINPTQSINTNLKIKK